MYFPSAVYYVLATIMPLDVSDDQHCSYSAARYALLSLCTVIKFKLNRTIHPIFKLKLYSNLIEFLKKIYTIRCAIKNCTSLCIKQKIDKSKLFIKIQPFRFVWQNTRMHLFLCEANFLHDAVLFSIIFSRFGCYNLVLMCTLKLCILDAISPI